MDIQKKIYEKDQLVTSGENNPEMILLLLEEKEIIFFPEYSKPYSFAQKTEVYEIIVTSQSKNSNKPENLASPFFLTGDACFYHFMARIINVSGEMDFYNKKGKDILWRISGEVTLKKTEEKNITLEEIPVILDEEKISYQIIGQGKVFLLKL